MDFRCCHEVIQIEIYIILSEDVSTIYVKYYQEDPELEAADIDFGYFHEVV